MNLIGMKVQQIVLPIHSAWLKHLYGLDLDTKVQELGNHAELSEFSKLIKAYIQDPKDYLDIRNDEIDCLPEIWNNLILIENLKKLILMMALSLRMT